MLLASSVDPNNMGLGQAGIIALLGYATVFFGLLLLMLVVMILGKAFTTAAKRKAAKEVVIPEPEVIENEPEPVLAPGSAGNLLLHDVEPKTAAMLMAIVADKMGKPLNELRFISIKEVK